MNKIMLFVLAAVLFVSPLAGVSVTVNYATLKNGSLVSGLTVDNSSPYPLNMARAFSAIDGNGVMMQMDLTNCPDSPFPAAIPAQTVVSGGVCWTGGTSRTARIYFKGALIWEVTQR